MSYTKNLVVYSKIDRSRGGTFTLLFEKVNKIVTIYFSEVNKVVTIY